jgi:hypothetical protein
MKFVVTKDNMNNPQWLKDCVVSSSPDIKSVPTLQRGFRFEVVDQNMIDRIKGGQFTIIDDGSPKNEAEIAKIDREVANETQRLKKMADEMKRAERAKNRASKNWYEKPSGILFLTVTGGVIIVIITAILCHYWPTWFHS